MVGLARNLQIPMISSFESDVIVGMAVAKTRQLLMVR